MGANLSFESLGFEVPGGGHWIAEGRVAPGERVVLRGPSGCGKTTFLKTLAGLHAATGGHLRYGEESLSTLSPQARRLGYVFQGGALFPHLDVTDNVAFGLAHLPGTKEWAEPLRRQRAREHLIRAGLEGVADRSIGALSGGERQRVALVRTLICEPRAVLLDEPLSAVDPERRRDLQDWILERIGANGAPLILVTHDAEEARRMGTKVVEWPKEPGLLRF